MNKLIARRMVWILVVGISALFFGCAPPMQDPSPPVKLSATDFPPPLEPTVTSSPSPIPPTPTPDRSPITTKNLFDLKPLYRFTGLNNGIRSVVFDPTGRYLVALTGGNSQGTDHRIHIWSAETGLEVASSEELGADTWDLAISPRGDSIAVGLHDGFLKIYSLPELSLVQTFNHPGQVNAVAFSPDGMYIAAGVAEAEGGMIYLWNLDQAVQVRRSWAHPYSVPSLAFSPNGQYLASGAVDRSVKIWQVSNGQLHRTLPQAGQGTSVRFNLGGEVLASGMCARSTSGFRCIDGQVWLWGVDDWNIAVKLIGPIDWVETVAFSPDGQLVGGGGRDFGIYLWERSSGTLLRSIPAHQGAVSGLAISPDGRLLASGASDGNVILWAIDP
jgi:WD40 repeat protein